MISVVQALDAVLAAARPLGAEEVPLDDALGRVLSEPLRARWDLPAFDNSAMDGYAVRAGDTADASPERPVRLRIVRRIFAGDERAGMNHAPIGTGQAARIMTGAAIPEGADSVVRQELVRVEEDVLVVTAPVPLGRDIRLRGEDVPTGRQLLDPGATVDPAAIGLLASFGHDRVRVGRRPRVVLLGTGDELVPVAEARPGAVVESNSHVLRALAIEAGAQAERLEAVGDEVGVQARALEQALARADVVVTIGGSSVGEHDWARAALAAVGADVRFWNVAIKPGRPMGFAVRGAQLLFALPGTPSAAAVTFELVVRPALRALQGAAGHGRPIVRGRLTSALRKAKGITQVLRARATLRDDGVHVDASALQGSGRVALALGANAAVVVPPTQGDLPPGGEVEVRLVGPLASVPCAPTVGFIGYSGSGKTTLLCRAIEVLAREGLRIGALKHDAHRIQMDREGKDTFRFRSAGARAIAIASKDEQATIASTSRSLTLAELRATLPGDLDLIVVEGYKAEDVPKVEVHRRGRPRLDPRPAGVVAVASDDDEVVPPGPDGRSPGPAEDGTLRFRLDDVEAVCEFLRSQAGRGSKGGRQSEALSPDDAR